MPRPTFIPSRLAKVALFSIISGVGTMSASAAPDHWILTALSTLVTARMDPIVSPGEVSMHVHSIVGASNFHQSLNSPEAQQAADCSSAIVGADKSNYWSPLLYYRYPNSTFAPVLGQTRIYYYTKTDDVQPFPPGLGMISGLARSRDTNDTRAQGVMLSCDHGEQTQFLPNGKSHPGGCSAISLGIYFPSCGLASGDLDSDDHFSHMAWPLQKNGGEYVTHPNGDKCPDSHPIKYPTIFFEANYYLSENQPWRNDEDLLVLSNGDTTGNTYHADFVNGWDQQVLGDAIKQCGLGNGPGEDLAKCAPLAKSLDEDASLGCRYQNQIPDEDVGLLRPLSSLPGCNPLWTASVPTKPTCDAAAASTNPAFVHPNTFFENLKFRTHIPMAVAGEVDGTSHIEGDGTSLLALVPSLGDTGASKVQMWASDGINKDSLKTGTLGEILAGLAGGSDTEAAPSSAASADSTAASGTGTAAASSPSESASASIPTSAVATTASTTTGLSTASAASATATASLQASDTASSTAIAAVGTATASTVQESTTAVGGVALVTGDATSSASSTVAELPSSSEATATLTTASAVEAVQSTAKTCKRKKRALIPKSALADARIDTDANLLAHFHRRARRASSSKH